MSEVGILAVAVAGLISTVVDLRTRRVPNLLVLVLATFGGVFATWNAGVAGLLAAVAGFGIGLTLMLPGHFLGATGAGDVKLFAAMGTLVGPAGIAVAFLYTALAGGVIAGFVAWRRRVLKKTVERTAELVMTRGANVAALEGRGVDNRFAYAPAIAIGTLAAALGL